MIDADDALILLHAALILSAGGAWFSLAPPTTDLSVFVDALQPIGAIIADKTRLPYGDRPFKDLLTLARRLNEVPLSAACALVGALELGDTCLACGGVIA